MATPDITVMGLGVFGLSIAYVCAKRGARVRAIDKRGIGAGSSGGTVGALAPHTPENWNAKKQFQFESLMISSGFWGEIDSVSGLSSGYARIGRLQSIETERGLELARKRQEGAAEFWGDQAIWEVVQGGSAWAPVSATGLLVRDTLSARIHPMMACQSLAGALTQLGVQIEIGDVTPDGPVVWATGYEGLEELSRQSGCPAGNGEKGQSLSLAYDVDDAPQLFSGGVHIVPHADGTVGIGSTTERDWDDATSTDEAIETLHAKALAICPALEGAAVVRRWAGVRPRAKSRVPMLGHWPDRQGQFIANGGFKIGFGMAPKIAHVMADLVLEGIDTIPEGFRVEDSL